MSSHLRPKTRRVAAFRPAARVSIVSAAVMIGWGILAVVSPSTAGLRPAILFGWLAVLSGVTHVTYALAAEKPASFLYGALVGAANTLGGVFLAVNPSLEWLSVTLMVSAVLLAQGILEFCLFLELRARPTSTWILFNSLVAVILGSVIWRDAFPRSMSAMMLTVGLNLIASGFGRLMQPTFAGRTPLRLVV